MKKLVNRILIGVSLAVTIALAMPLSFMTASIVRGESPKQIAEKEAVEDTAETDAVPVEPTTQTDYVKPQVQPDPVSAAEPETEPVTEPAVQPSENPAPAPKTSSGTANKKAAAKTASTKQESTQSKDGLPKAVLAPGEAPCFIDGLDGYSYDYSAANQPTAAPASAPVQQTEPQTQEATTADAGNGASAGYGVSPSELDGSATVYVSNRSSKIHSYSYCSGMKYYREMTKADAESHGYAYCKDCW